MIPSRAAIVLVLLPLVFTGKAMLVGGVYGPADLYYGSDPWRRLEAAAEVGAPRNPILSDLAFANLPWRAALKEAVANGRAPLWNRFTLSGTPLLPAAQAGVFHPSTVLALWLPLALSWTFSCAFTLFLALLSAYLFLRELELDVLPSLLGAAAWAFSTYLLFWIGWSVGPSTATFPFLLLGLRRLAREPGAASILLTAAAFWLSVCGGHPESAFHTAAAGGVFFLWELSGRRASIWRALGAALVSAALAIALAGPQLFPLLEAIPQSAEYRFRREAVAASAGAGAGAGRQSVSLPAAARRLLPDLLPFAHGIYGKSPVQAERRDGSGMPVGYAGALVFPLATVALLRSARRRERVLFLLLSAAGLLYGASAPGLMDLTARLPGFSLALNHRLVFLAGLGLAGLAALGAQALLEDGTSARRLASASIVWALALGVAFLLSRGVFRERGLSERFLLTGLALEAAPLLLLAVCSRVPALAGAPLAAGALLLLVGQRGAEMAGTYPTLSPSTLAPALPTLSSVPLSSEPCRVVATADTLRPNGSALYGLEDVRGYESLVLDRFTDTYPLWAQPQAASFNRVPSLSSSFLSFLNACFAIAAPEEAVPAGWREQARGTEMAIFSNPGVLPRAFVPERLRRVPDPAARLQELARETDFRRTAWVSGSGPAEEANGSATLTVRAVGPELVLRAHASSEAVVATSIPDWPGWMAWEGERPLPRITVNHAFVGFRLPAGDHTVRLAYAPRSWRAGLWAFGAGALAAAALATRRRRSL